MTITSNRFSTIYKMLLDEIYNNPDYIDLSPRGFKIKEKTNIELLLTNPKSNLYINNIRPPKLKYLYGELLWYFLGRDDLEFISKYSTFWEKIAKEDGTVNSAYGNLLFKEKNTHGITEWQWAFNSLVKDQDSRQAIMRFNKPHHSYDGNKDFVCTLTGIFHIRNNKLNFTTTMRSQDMWFGIIYDIPFFTLLQQQMRLHLLPHYPDLELGSYRHYVISAHIYEKDFETIESMLKEEFVPSQTPTIDEHHPLVDSYGMPTKELMQLELLSLGVHEVVDFDHNTKFGDPLYDEFYKYIRS